MTQSPTPTKQQLQVKARRRGCLVAMVILAATCCFYISRATADRNDSSADDQPSQQHVEEVDKVA